MSFLAFDALTSNVTLTIGDKIPSILMNSKKPRKSSKTKNV